MHKNYLFNTETAIAFSLKSIYRNNRIHSAIIIYSITCISVCRLNEGGYLLPYRTAKK
jgi:hypothetical protein